MNKTTFYIEGMTCSSCVAKITDKISQLKDVQSAKVSLESKSVDITSSRPIALSEVRSALESLPKYSVSDKHAALSEASSQESKLKTYKPLITIFVFILMTSLAYQFSLESFQGMLFMNHIMAGFFIGLSFFKFLDLNAFAESFSGYDPVAKRWLGYGKIYPVIELSLGLLFVSGKFLALANSGTILILTLTTYGVYKKLQLKSSFQCACLGTGFSLPLSNVTIFENVAMIAMAALSLTQM